MTDIDVNLSGEQRLRLRRRAFWRYSVLVMLAALGGGIASGMITASYQDGNVAVWLPLLAFAALMAGGIWYALDYFRRIDELDLMDNLWAHTFGLYAGCLVFAGWYFLGDLGLVDHPGAPAIVATMLIATLVAYGLRKLGLR